MMSFEFVPGAADEVTPLIEKLQETAKKLGLYMDDGVMIVTPDGRAAEDLLEEGKSVKDVVLDGGSIAFVARFAIGDVAWRKRTLDPEQHDIDKQVRMMLPSEAEQICQRLLEGGPLFEDDDQDAESGYDQRRGTREH